MSSDMIKNEYLPFAIQAAENAGQIALKYFRSAVSVDDKPGKQGFDPVTIADKEIKTCLRQAIIQKYPGHAIVGEEEEDVTGSDDYKWFLDPIDGTRSFISGSPLWGILIGLVQAKNYHVGVMHQPYLQETFYGSSAGTFLKRGDATEQISTRDVNQLGKATLYCTHPSIFSSQIDLERFNKVAEQCQLMRFGGDCYGYCLLALGSIDLVIEADLQAYDIIPLIPIIEAAGGLITDWQGNNLTDGGNVIAAGNVQLHEQALKILNS